MHGSSNREKTKRFVLEPGEIHDFPPQKLCLCTGDFVPTILLDMNVTDTPVQVMPDDLVGSWRGTHCEITIDWVFSPGGAFSGKISIGDRVASDFSGTWTVEGDHLVTKYASDAYGNIKPGSWDRDRFLERGTDYFVIRTCSGDRRHTLIK